ncbi:hypothetical protein L1987_57614 [Smallanthus sonchifolius]|uniref:Uncharacterized protein n=1 Tax=Smallanthus sonchifolius TaxID=185202 RepID=A0ACB9DDJ0_9ASTR|nr:hypothetical protein L1987_57614 [Smallanthus sonchifolius]
MEDGEGSMTLKNVDGKEWVTGLRLAKAFDKFIRSEGKLLLAKVTKKKWPAGEIPVMEVRKRGRRRPGYELGSDVDMKRPCGQPPKQNSCVAYF